MIIANSSPLMGLSTPKVSNDAMVVEQMAGQVETPLANSETLDSSLQDGDFWLLLNEQLVDVSADETLQVIENKQLSGMPGEAGNKLPADWTNGMKVHFSENDLSDIDALSETTDPLVAAVALPADAANSLAINGDKLPSHRQIVSAVATTGVTATEAKTINHNISTSANIDMIDVESDKLSSTQLSESDLNKAGLDAEKMQAKLSFIDQNGGSVMKDNLAPIFQQVNQPSASAIQNQSVSPSSLQTLQLPAQATSSQWGEALGEKVTLLLSNKLNIAEIRIDPPHLGKLDIQIQVKDDSASILINTQHAHTRELIESASIRLKEFLQEAGYTSVDVDVSHQEQSMAEGDVSGQDDDGQNENSDQHNLAAQGELAELQQKEISFNVDDGRIDYFA